MTAPADFVQSIIIKLFYKLDIHTKEVLSGALIAFALRSVGAVLVFVLNVLIGRLLGAEGAGLYFLALSVVTIGAVITKLGLDNALLRFIATGASSSDWNKVVGVFQLGMRMAACASLAAAALVFIFAPWIAERLFDEVALTSTLRAMCFGIFTFAMMTLLAESLKGLKRIRDSMLVSSVLYPGIALIMIWPLARQFGASGAAAAYVLGTGLATLIGWIMWRTNIDGVAAAAPRFERAILWRSCRPLWAMSIINRGALTWTPLLLLGFWGSTEEAGVFGAATRVAMLVALFSSSVNAVIAPKLAELYNQGEIETLGKLARRFSLLVTVAASPILLLMIVAGDWVMGLFGPDFIQGGTALAILAIGQVINTITGPVGYVLIMTGYERDSRNASALSLVLLLGCAIMLVPDQGLIGAATAGAAATIMGNVYKLLLAQRRLNILLPSARFGA